MLWGGKLLVETILQQTRTPLICALTEEWDKLPQQLLDNVVQSLETELAIPFVPNRDLPDTPQQNRARWRSCIIIRQNEVVTNSSSIWADIWIKDPIPISKTSYGSFHGTHMQVSVNLPSEIPAQTRDSTTSITVSFNSVGLMVSSALFPPDQ
ncbi:hypothetical protein TNCV_4151051 [Trichonephila clavipes]|nr:hypothetical protein TNCV_4151051 [Trichonephila clavipes]